MTNKIIWILFATIFISVFAFFMTNTKRQLAGDIVEFYGITETVLNHNSLDLKPSDSRILSEKLNPGYLSDPQYYIEGKDGIRFPVHFFAYSLFLIPIRMTLQSIGVDTLKIFPIGNLLILSFAAFLIMKKFIRDNFKKLIFLMLIFLSPLSYFLVWPGAEVFSTSLLLLSIFYFYQKRFIPAVIFAIFASWQTQPLLVVPLFYLVFYIFSNLESVFVSGRRFFSLNLAIIWKILILGILLSIPFAYNYLVFGTVDPWFLLAKVSFWTKFWGFGFHNISFKKTFELFFDPNIGLFWYAPVLMITGLWSYLLSIKENRWNMFLLIPLALMACLYQTNPNWNNGTSGYGPTRYALYFIPFLIYFTVKYFKLSLKYMLVLALFILTQLYVFDFNGYLTPDFEKSLYHNPYAKFFLNNYPQSYNPSPEIFVERTAHKEENYWNTTVYKYGGICKKAYVISGRQDQYTSECDEIPQNQKLKLKDDFIRTADYPRILWTTEATLKPMPQVCLEWMDVNGKTPYVCMRTIGDVIRQTKVDDKLRFKQVNDYTGMWKMEWGEPTELIVPAGYTADYFTFNGTYIDGI